MSLKAGWYYLAVDRYDRWGTYQIYLDYTPQPFKDPDTNYLASQALPLQLNQLAQGALGYGDQFYRDNADWYRVDVSVKGRYKLLLHTVNSILCYIDLYSSNMVTRLLNDNRWASTDALAREVDLDPGTYYIKVTRYDGYGGYNLIFGDVSNVIAGKLTGKVTAKSKLPLAEINVQILDKVVKTNALGEYVIENVPAGKLFSFFRFRHEILSGKSNGFYNTRATYGVKHDHERFHKNSSE